MKLLREDAPFDSITELVDKIPPRFREQNRAKWTEVYNKLQDKRKEFLHTFLRKVRVKT